jgi:hypothetical protein
MSYLIGLSPVKLIVSPSGTEYFGEKWRILAKTNLPSASWIHISVPVLFRDSKKEASMLHFILPWRGSCHAVMDEVDEVVPWWALSRPWGGTLGDDVPLVIELAELQYSIRWYTLPTTLGYCFIGILPQFEVTKPK